MNRSKLDTAFGLKGIKPQTKLAAIYVADHCDEFDVNDPEERFEINLLVMAEWCGCHRDQALDRLGELMDIGFLKEVTFVDPSEPDVVEALWPVVRSFRGPK
ncbi:MAG: hypothetical protein AAFY24_01980 [Pseudomonadota bacterium]